MDKSRTYSGGMDKVLKMYDVTTGIETPIGDHDKAIRCVVPNITDGMLKKAGNGER